MLGESLRLQIPQTKSPAENTAVAILFNFMALLFGFCLTDLAFAWLKLAKKPLLLYHASILQWPWKVDISFEAY